MKRSRKIVASIVGPNVAEYFKITVRKAVTSGFPTFSLWYIPWRRWGKILLLLDVPLKEVKEALRRIAERNTIKEFFLVEELIEELQREERFYRPLLQSEEWRWCPHCEGLLKGRVVRSDDHYILSPEGNFSPYGRVVKLCSCSPSEPSEVEIVLGRYFIVEGLLDLNGNPLVIRDKGQLQEGQTYRPWGGKWEGTLRELGFFASFEEAEEAARQRQKRQT